MIEEIDQETFNDLWHRSVELACPLTRGHPERGTVWLWNTNSDPCKSKVCKWIGCHTYDLGWDEHQKLLVPINSKKETEKPNEGT